MQKNLSWVVLLMVLAMAGESALGQASTTRVATQPAATLPAASKPATTMEAEAEPAKLHCQVFNQAGMGLAKATIEASILGGAGWIPLTTEVTGRTGACDLGFPAATPTLLQLKVQAKGYQAAETLYLPRANDVVPWLTITLKGAQSLEGRVVTEDDQGVGSATVTMDTPAGMMHTQTREDGSFWFDNLMPMKAALIVRVPGVGVGAYHVDLTAETIKPVTIVLYAQRRVTLQVLGDQGKPLPGAMVEVLAPQAMNAATDGEGRIQINGVGSGRGQVVVTLHDDYYRLDEPAVRLGIDEGDEPVDLEVVATRGGLVEGQVVERESGEPIPAAIVWFVAGGKFGPNITCDVEGKFKFEAIPEDDYLVAAGHATYSFAVASAEVEAGKKVTLKFALADGATIQGAVVDTAGKPVPRAIVRAMTWVPRELAEKVKAGRAGAVQIPWRAVRTNDEGEYVLESLPAGRVRLETADENGRHLTSMNVEIGVESKVLEVNLKLKGQEDGPPM